MRSIAFSTSLRYGSRRVLIHVTTEALRCWGAEDDDAGLFATFTERAPEIQEIAFDIARADPACTEVVVDERTVQACMDRQP